MTRRDLIAAAAYAAIVVGFAVAAVMILLALGEPHRWPM